MMKTIRLTMAQALVKYLCAQRTIVDGDDVALFGGVFAIFGHGNVTCLGEALETVKDQLPTWRGQNEQSMALAGIAYAKAKKRRQIMVATSSIGPGAMNMVTAAGVAHSNRLPILLLSGDTFINRVPDPVLQQVEHFNDPTMTVNDAFKPVARYWDRITRPEQIISSLPQAIRTMLDPADCGPAFLSLCQDTQAEAYDYPEVFFETKVWRIPRPRPDVEELVAAAEALRKADKPLIVAGGGVHYSGAHDELAAFAERHRVPVVETIAGRAVMVHDHPNNAGPLGVIGSASANALAAEADVVLAIGTRLQDFTTGSWTVFKNEGVKIIALNAARFDATKHRALPVVGDAQAGLAELGAGLAGWQAPKAWMDQAAKEYAGWNEVVDQACGPDQCGTAELCPCGRRDQSGRRPHGPRLDRGRRPAGRALQDLARQNHRHLRLRVRLFLHGLRDRRRLGGEDGRSRARRDRVLRRRLLPHDELGHLFIRAHRPEADRRGLRQWRLCRDQPPAELQGVGILQQPDQGLPDRKRGRCRLRGTRQGDGR